MLKDGTYAAWFKTSQGEGTGIVHFADGQIWGVDSIVNYSGSCEVDGDRFTAIVSIKRHTEGHATVFGIDDVSMRLVGTCSGKVARYVGTSDQVPGILLEGTLIRNEGQPAVHQAIEPMKFDPHRLPKLSNRFR